MTSLSGTMPILWTCFLFFWIPSIQGQIIVKSANPRIVRLNDSLEILCQVPGKVLELCMFKQPGKEGNTHMRPSILNVNPRYFGSGFENGDCGMRYDNVGKNTNGTWTCSILIKGQGTDISKNIDVIVAEPPKDIILTLSQTQSSFGAYDANSKIVIECNPTTSFPAANVTLYLEDEVLKTAVGNLSVSHTLKVEDHEKKIRCVAEHFASDKNLVKEKMLNVYYEPQKIDEADLKLFNFVIGRPEFVNVTINANPMPELSWTVDEEIIRPGGWGDSGRYSALPIQPLGKGKWIASLKIDGFQKVDTEREYTLHVNNLKGSNTYPIQISLSSKSDAQGGVDIDAGYIVAIIAVILVVLLTISLIVFARVTGRCCFAGGSTPRNIGESDPAASVSLLQFKKIGGRRSDTESGRYSRTEVDSSNNAKKPRMRLSNLFQRNKGSETMETVTATEEEKLPESEVITEKSTPEGGLVYAELDLTQRQVDPPARSINNDKTEYAEIICKKPDEEESNTTTTK